MCLELSTHGFLDLSQDDLSEGQPDLLPLHFLLNFGIQVALAKEAGENDFDEKVRRLSDYVDPVALLALFGAPVLSDNADGRLLHHLDHLLELLLIQGGTQSLSLLLPHEIAACKDYAIPSGPLE